MDFDGKFIMCVACKKDNDRAQSKNEKLTCERGSIFKYDHIKTCVDLNHHKVCIQKSQKECNANFLTNDKFNIKCGHIFTARRATTVTAFFSPEKKPK